MPKQYSEGDWKGNILSNLKKRNEREKGIIEDLIHAHNRFFDVNEQLKQENSNLSYTIERLKQENSQLHQNVGTAPSPTSIIKSDELTLIQQLEKKIFKQQEELTEMHRRRSEFSQQLVDLNQCLQERDKLFAVLKNKSDERDTDLLLTKEALLEKDKKIEELEYENQVLRDEYQALNMMHNSLEEKYKKCQVETQELVQRWMILKEKDAERLNEENAVALRKRQEIVEEKLKEASLEVKIVNEGNKFACVSPICISVSLPSKSYLQFDAHEGEVTAIAFSPQGKIVATGGADRRIKLWDISHGTIDSKGTLAGSNAGVNAIDFDSDESLVLGASNDEACRIWTAVDLRIRHTLTGHSGKVMACKFLSDPSKVVTGSHDRTLKIWDLRSRSCTKTLFPGSSCNDLAVSDSHLTTIISGHFDKTVKLWDMRLEQPTVTVPLLGKVTSLSLSKDNFYLLCCVRDDTLKILDLRQNQVMSTFSSEGFVVGADYTRAVFTPDDSYAVCGSNSGSIFIWNVTSGRMEKELTGHSACVLACSWHPNGRTLVSCDRAKKVLAWGAF